MKFEGYICNFPLEEYRSSSSQSIEKFILHYLSHFREKRAVPPIFKFKLSSSGVDLNEGRFQIPSPKSRAPCLGTDPEIMIMIGDYFSLFPSHIIRTLHLQIEAIASGKARRRYRQES
jgi:hypothetical protein